MELILSLTEIGGLPVIIAFLTVILVLLKYRQKRYINLPPGPKGYPIIGNILDITPEKVLETFRKCRIEYGDLFTIYLGTHLSVVVNGYENLKELFSRKGDAVSDRPPNFVFKDMFKESGIVSSSGHLWKIHRPFTMKSLKGFGFGKRSIESNIMEEVNEFLKDIAEQDGKPFNLHNLVHVCISNVICSITFGKRFEHQDLRFKTLLKLKQDIFKNAAMSGPVSAFSVLQYLPGDPFGARRLLRNVQRLQDFVQNIIDEHRTSFDSENVRDYIDVYLKEQTEGHGSEKDTFTDEQLNITVMDLFLAGTETTATSIKWFVLYLLHNQIVQKKMAAEIERVVGVSNLPSFQDKPNLPYCEAVITEVMRCSNITPLSAIHYASEDVEMSGFTIPKGCYLFQNLDSVMKDPELFPNPEEFQPERFIDAEGKFGGQDRVIPFSIGRRVCLGESLARAELFLLCTSLIQRFTLSPVEGKPLPTLEGKLGITYMPESFDFIAIKRK